MAQTITITVEDNKTMSAIKKLLSLMNGVSIQKFKPSTKTPNACTLRAMKDCAEGKTHKASSVDDMFSQILG